MILLEPQPTPYDVQFRFFGTPVRVHPMFWVLGLVFGWGLIVGGEDAELLPRALIWLAVMFVSVLAHELGHVWAGRVFGTHSHVVLYSFGGLAIPDRGLPDWWQRAAVSFAGPLAGFLLAGAVFAGLAVAAPVHFDLYTRMFGRWFGLSWPGQLGVPEDIPRLLEFAVLCLLLVNILWGVLNLLPVWPLDGGQIARAVLGRLAPGQGLRLSLGLSVLVAGVLAVHSFLRSSGGAGLIPFLPIGSQFTAIMFGLLAVQNFLQLRQTAVYEPQDPWQGRGRPWERDDDRDEDDDYAYRRRR